MVEIKLETKLVGEIEGSFFIPSYQRGYRWRKEEVIRLLDDIYNIYNTDTHTSRNYCLQPIVVRKIKEQFELIDGQQRLTTLYLIYKFMNLRSGGFIEEPKFTLQYQTRTKSEQFLKQMDLSLKEENVDFWFICNAYETIEAWFQEKGKLSVTMTNINKFFSENVKIIWYEVEESEDAIALFTRLNIGKIPLTSAELVKSMFLSNKNETQIKQEEIALQWDAIEKQLHQNSFWYFLTNDAGRLYQTRIDLLLDLISGKETEKKETYATFFYFDALKKQRDLKEIWQEIVHTFLLLKDWFGNHEFYHKIGYLIASGYKTLSELYLSSKEKTKKEFRKQLDTFIRESIAISKNYGELRYEQSGDYAKISRLLLLFNVESVRKNGIYTQWFPFDQFKYQKDGKTVWTLEHIHAQQSEGLRKQEDWKEWITLHIPSIEALGEKQKDLLQEMKRLKDKEKLERQEFEAVQAKVIQKLSVQGNVEYLHSIANLALLNYTDNIVLSNATFDVKRNRILQMDKNGMYIPFCTKMVFLKYYTPSEKNQIHFWGQADRIAYIAAMNTILKEYLKEEILIGEEEKYGSNDSYISGSVSDHI